MRRALTDGQALTLVLAVAGSAVEHVGPVQRGEDPTTRIDRRPA